MNYKYLAAIGTAATIAMVAPASANTTIVGCPGYAISMSDDVAIQGQVQAGSVAAFEKIVCERSSDAADLEGGAKVIPVFIAELGIATRVVVFPQDENN